ncbi:MAG: hypothetical protein KGZ67_10190 [Hydrogenophaga sp.]|jgi:hypothetical protein|nr:hypothetical protein [Hydrogenophaga sp.]
MSFLNQLKQQAQTLQNQQGAHQQQSDAQLERTEAACKVVWQYLMELPRQLNVIEPASAALSLDGKTPWPDMKQHDFRFDARKKTLRDKEVFDYLAIGWYLSPRQPLKEKGRVSVNFPPDLERVERRLQAGQVPHDRLEFRHPDTHRLQRIVFEHGYAARASVVFTPDHDAGSFKVRLVGVGGLETMNTLYPVVQLNTAALDELAKLIVGEHSRFI